MKEKRILLVEDDSDHAELIIEGLNVEDINKKVILMKDGQEVIDYFHQSVIKCEEEIQSIIGLIILDLNMPKVNGMDVLRFIKRSPEYSSIPVIIVSTSHDTETISEAYKNGANGFITKSHLYDEEFFEHAKLLSEYCKSALSEDFSTSKDSGDKFVAKQVRSTSRC